jgi:hypothetical protein
LGGGERYLFNVKFSFAWDKVNEIFDGTLVYVFHESFNDGFWNFQIGKFVNGVLMCIAPLTPTVMNDEGVGLPSLILYGVNYGVVFGVFMCEGLVGEYVVTICEFNELNCECGEGDIGVCVKFGAPIMHRISGLNFGLALACCLCACAFKEPLRNCLFGWCVIKVAYIGQCEEPGVFVDL